GDTRIWFTPSQESVRLEINFRGGGLVQSGCEMKFPFDELNMCDAEHVGWVKSQRDPELWHAAAIAIVNTVGDPNGFLVWLADQPETDRATAGYFFLGVFGVDYLRGQT